MLDGPVSSDGEVNSPSQIVVVVVVKEEGA